MFNVNDVVVYGLNGICTIVDIKQICFGSVGGNAEQYYYLHPIDSKDDHLIYVPVNKVNNDTSIMRPLMCRADLERFLDDIRNIDMLEIKNEKSRRDEYKAAILTLSLEKCIALIKSVKNRRKGTTRQRKNISEADFEFEKLALKLVCHELSVVLGIAYEEAEYRVVDEIDFA